MIASIAVEEPPTVLMAVLEAATAFMAVLEGAISFIAVEFAAISETVFSGSRSVCERPA